MSELDEAQKWVIGLYCTILFVIVSAPWTYRITGKITKRLGWITSNDGKPNGWGLFLHAIVFLLLLRLIMLIPKPDV